MSGTPDAQLIATPAYRQRIAECILDGVNRYKQAVTNQIPYQKPSAIVAATDPTSVPSLEKVVPNVGSTISIDSSVSQAQELSNPPRREIESLKRLPSFPACSRGRRSTCEHTSIAFRRGPANSSNVVML